jgi:hypothetical protein
MVEPVALGFGVVVAAICLWFGYRVLTAVALYRALSATDSYSATGIVDGETAAIEGNVVVEEPAALSERAVPDTTNPIGAFVWRILRPKRGNEYEIDFENRTLEQKTQTVEDGIEWGRFAVDDGHESIRVDPSWLAETHDSTSLSDASLSGLQSSSTISNRTWASPYMFLNDCATETTLDEMGDIVEADETDATLRRQRFESKAIPEGQSLAVRGEVTVEQGDPVIRGTEETPLAISDRGFGGLGSNLKRQVAKYGLMALVLLPVAVLLLLRGTGVPIV